MDDISNGDVVYLAEYRPEWIGSGWKADRYQVHEFDGKEYYIPLYSLVDDQKPKRWRCSYCGKLHDDDASVMCWDGWSGCTAPRGK